jgi:tetratricopeptide (TPR) repeat protein
VKLALLFVLVVSSLFAQHDHSSTATAEKPVVLESGLGTWRHAISTSSPLAQDYFNQGLVLVYSFNRYEALRSFRKAAELDPKAAMPYWGIAMALGPYLNMDFDPSYQIKDSCEAVKKGLALERINETDRLWLKAAEQRCPDFTDPARYIAAMRDLAARYPDDPDAQTLYAEALIVRVRWRCYDSQGRPAEGVPEAESALESVLRRFPYHPGANHLYIHVVEASPTPERAVPSAQRLMGIVPHAGHMVHMPGHIWLVLGDFDNAVAVNERAAQVDREYFAATGITGTYYPYYLHNLHFILYARAMQGRLSDTEAAAVQFSDALIPMEQVMPEMAGMFYSQIAMARLRLYQWDRVLSIERPKTQDPLTGALWHYTRAVALAGKRQFNEAKKERAEFQTLKQKVDPNAPWDTNKTGDVLAVADAVLDARLEQSIAKWQKAVDLQDGLTYGEPPAWYYPVRESLGAALLRSGDAAAAEGIFREGLRRSPNNGRMLFGLLESLKAQRKLAAAAWVEKEFKTAWTHADITLRLEDL